VYLYRNVTESAGNELFYR